MPTIGPYTFTDEDARRTVACGEEVFELYAQGRDRSVIAALAPRVTGDTQADLAAVWQAWTAAGPALRAAGELPARQEGTVAHLHASGGGLPKLPVARAEIGWGGVAGDVQATRKHHGRPWQALCLWSTEVIEALRAQGHPVGPGLAGENITVSGLDWAEVRPGVRLRVGTALCEVSAYALPCSKTASCFVGGDFSTMHHERGPVSRVYATVLEPGAAVMGDPVVLEP